MATRNKSRRRIGLFSLIGWTISMVFSFILFLRIREEKLNYVRLFTCTIIVGAIMALVFPKLIHLNPMDTITTTLEVFE